MNKSLRDEAVVMSVVSNSSDFGECYGVVVLIMFVIVVYETHMSACMCNVCRS